ncbi:MAG: anti-sigma factor antagonist [Clostridia bacterium]|nr:anti-sigma factor antagonist [Clostridia bacterium]
MALLNSEIKGNVLFLMPSGRIDSTNASDIQAEIDEIVATNPHDVLIFDCENLEYISSAGLRIVLKLGKTEKEFEVINANSEVYDIFDMTGFSEILTVKKAYRKFSVDGCEIIGQGAKGTVYRYDPETIVKVYNDSDSLPDIKRERELARKAFVLGVPTAISYDVVKVGDKFGSVFELLDTKSLSEYIADEPENFDKYVKCFADLLLQIHSTDVDPDDMPSGKEKFQRRVEHIKDYIPEEMYTKLHDMLDAMPEVTKMIHCDYHTNNVLLQNGEVILIDMDTLSYGHPIFELANIHIAYVGFGIVNPKMVEDFIGLPYETTKRIWSTFLRYYLGTDDEQRILDVENKVSILSYVRYIRHVIRRGINNEEDQIVVDTCIAKIGELLNQVDSLEF